MKTLILFFVSTVAMWAQWSAVPSTNYPALEAILNAKPATTSGTGAPTSLACTAGKDIYLDTVALNLYDCVATGNPGTWVQRVLVTGSYVNPSFISSLAWGKITGAPTFLLAANNLGDVVSAATARTNLGLGSAAVQSASVFAPATSGAALLKGNGAGGFASAASTDIISVFTGCSGAQYLGADGACHTVSGGATIAATTSVLKGNGLGNGVAAVAGTDYQAPISGAPSSWPTITNTVFGRSGAVTAQSGDYTTSLVPEGTNQYFTSARAQAAMAGLYQVPISGAPGSWPTSFTPTAHAATHEYGGSDPVGVATPIANAIPMAGAGGTLAAGWIPTLNQNTTGNSASATVVAGTMPPSINGGLVAEYRLDEQVGGTAYNSVYPKTISNDLLGNYATPGFTFFTQGTATNTANNAMNRDGLPIASRVQITGTNFTYTSPSSYATLFVPGQTYTLSMDVISNTGSAQALRLGTICCSSTMSANLTVGTTWSRIYYTFTASSNSQYIILYTDSNGDALDISYDRVQLDAGSAPTGWDSHLFNLQLGSNKWVSDTTTPSWSAPWLVFTGTQRAVGLGNWSPITLSTMTAYTVVQQTSDASPQYQPVWGNDNGNFSIWADYATSGPGFKVYWGTTSAGTGSSIRVADGNPHVLAETYNGATLTAYMDGVPLASTTATVAPQALTDLELGHNDNQSLGSFFYNGKVAYASLYNTPHSTTQVQTITALLKARMAQLGVTIPAWKNWVMFEGDSITATGWPATAQIGVTTTAFPQGVVTAVAGSKLSDIVSREAADDATLLAAPTRDVLVLLVGANDAGDTGGASGFETALKAYCLAQKAAGWNKVVLLTLLPQTTSGFNAFRDAVNSLIVADTSFYDAIVRLDLDSVMGCDSCAANPTYYSDGIHPTTAGANLIAADVLPVLQGVLQ